MKTSAPYEHEIKGEKILVKDVFSTHPGVSAALYLDA
jgi:hypothetical protein